MVVNYHNSCGIFVASCITVEWNGHTTPNLLLRQAYDASFAVQSNKLVRLSEIFLSQQTLMLFILDVVYDLYPGVPYEQI